MCRPPSGGRAQTVTEACPSASYGRAGGGEVAQRGADQRGHDALEGRDPHRPCRLAGWIADLMIAVTAIAEDLAIFTTNPGDYAGLDKLVHIAPSPGRPSRISGNHEPGAESAHHDAQMLRCSHADHR